MKLPLIIWLVLASLEALRHVYLVRVDKVSPDKFKSLVMRCVVATGLGLCDVIMLDKWSVQMVLTYWFSGWFIHDSITGLGIHGYPHRLNDTGWLDRLQRYSIGDFPAWVLKGIAGLTLIAMYFFNE
jgi:hypothetical protein